MWPNGKKWVYSISYDEGCELLLKNVLPIHRELNIPGHISVVAKEVGKKKESPHSSFYGMKILNRDQILSLREEGWGISCHSMTHTRITEKNAKEEVIKSKLLLEKLLGIDINIFCVPADNRSYYPALNLARRNYKAIMTIYDKVNHYDGDLMRLGRVALHDRYPFPFYSEFDPYKRIHQAIDQNGWIIDYCHIPMEVPIHLEKDCSLNQLVQRFEKIIEIGKNNVWLAEIGEVIDYISTKKR